MKSKLKSLTITLPNHKAVSWNALYSSKHWTVRSKLAKRIHQEVFGAVFEVVLAPRLLHYPVDIILTAFYKDKKLRDSDNLASKVYIDGLKGVLLEDDDYHYVRRVTTEVRVGQKEDKLEISIEEKV